MSLDSTLAARLSEVRARVADAAARSGRAPEEITLVGVSKRQPAASVVAAVQAGLGQVGESFAQEAAAKLPEVEAALEGLGLKPPRWHFVGHLQRNKAGTVAGLFDSVQSVDRAGLGEALARRAREAGRHLEVLLQVNLSAEPQKGGATPEETPQLLAASRSWEGLDVTGLMTIPAAGADPRPAFARLRELREALRGEPGGAALRELSMGMSGDFELAIEEGATIVRVGTAIFGPRPPAGG